MVAIWQVQLTGDTATLSILAASLTAAPLKLVARADGYWMEADDFRALETPEAVREHGRELAATLTAFARVHLAERGRIGLANVRREGERPVASLFGDPAVAYARGAMGSLSLSQEDGATDVHRPADKVQAWIRSAAESAEIAKLHRLRAREPFTWDDIARILELSQSVVGARGGLDSNMRSRIDRVMRTANSVGAIGDSARHGVERTQAPRQPLGLDEAVRIVDELLAELSSRS